MYDSEGNPDKGQLVELYAPLVKRIAFHLMAKLPSSVNIDDLMQNGMIGLLDAVDRYEDGAAQFETYASQRIRGAMLDGLREDDWMPRSLRRDMRRVEAAVQTLEQRFGRAPNETELAGEIGVPLPEYQQILQEARGHQLVYFEDFKSGEDEDFFEHHVVDQDADPLGLLEDADFRRALVSAIGALPEREQLVMSLYYDEELNLREIGEVLGVTESRVCQLHSQAVARLRANVFGEGAPAPAKRRGRPPRSKG
ncbi:RNA polymerase sigma factor FliA [Pseudazoarcus pumilus]|uniref:RNA polymerase sigma factor FliA n=1 Tax=Pseudazoarcus pumilus TaxID=2067960 RepID=A0A2I6S8I3_9RHOO|nr:RNA polymerase sigma factor FliA [Pseudazoarcus pumilus]AUN95564.1 RNA polymerase sigma factor FliA [Pseudazoarcus pumilus]